MRTVTVWVYWTTLKGTRGGPEGSNTNKKETAHKKKKMQIENKNANKKRKTEVNRKREGPEFLQAALFSVLDTDALDSCEERRLIEHYFLRGFQNQVIVDFLHNRHAVTMSLSTLKRRLRDHGLGRRGADVSDHEANEIV